MNPTKEELDEAIANLKLLIEGDWKLSRPIQKTIITILTRYRDGELVEKEKITLCPECGGAGYSILISSTTDCCGNMTQTGSCCNNPIQKPVSEQGPCILCQCSGFITTPPTNQTEKP